VFPDAFLPNLGAFLLGQVAAWGYLRTGMVRRGVLLMLLVLVLADWALLARFAFEQRGLGYLAPLLAMQIIGVAGAVWLAFGLLRRRFSATARRRAELFAQGQRHYLCGQLDSAGAAFRRLHRNDPWDVPSAIALANVLARCERPRAARRLYRQARSLDRRREYHDLVEAQLALVAGRRPRR
jgi:tetratricopeptide (TPR) repeat protein